MVAYFWRERRREVVRDGVRPRKLVGCFEEEAGRGRRGSSVSSTGEGSISCMGYAEMEVRESRAEMGGRSGRGLEDMVEWELGRCEVERRGGEVEG
jgi:hypothetical protein